MQGEGQEDQRGGILTQGLEDAGSFLRGTNRLEVWRQGWVIAHSREEAIGGRQGTGHLLLLQLIQLLHRFQTHLEVMVLEGDEEERSPGPD